MSKLTKRRVDALSPGDREYIDWDDELRGFGCRVHPTGRKTFVFKYRVGGGRNGLQRKMTLGAYSEAFTAEQARSMARDKSHQATKGEDPAQQRQEHRVAELLEDFCKRYVTDYATPRKKPSSVKGDRWLLNVQILPALGDRKVVDITTADLNKFIQGLADRPFLANRCRALLSKIFSLAQLWNVRPDPINPVRAVLKFPERSRQRFLSTDEIKTLGDVLRVAEAEGTEPWQAIAAIRLLLFTGCRRTEIVSLKWEYIDYDNQAFLLPESKTGAKTVYVSAPVLEILENLPRQVGSPFVLPACRKEEGFYAGIGHAWERIREKAKLDSVRLHDLRHTYASTGVGLRVGLTLLGGLLGHARATTTEKYAHLAADPTRKAGASIARRLRAHLGPSGNVIPFGGAPKRSKGAPAVHTVPAVRKARKALLGA